MISDVASSSTQSERSPGESSSTLTQIAKRNTLPTLRDGIQYSQNTQRLARELRCSAAEEKRWIANMMGDSESEEESLENISTSWGISSPTSVGSYTDTVSPASPEEREAKKVDPAVEIASTPRKTFTAKEIYAMLPSDSPDLSKPLYLSRKRAAKKGPQRKRKAHSRNQPIVESSPERIPSKKARKDSDELSATTSPSLSEVPSILASETSSSWSQESQTEDNSSPDSVSETITSSASSEGSQRSSCLTPPSSQGSVSATRGSRCPSQVSSPESTGTNSDNVVSRVPLSPRVTRLVPYVKPSEIAIPEPPSVPPGRPPPFRTAAPLHSQFEVSCRIETNQGVSTSFNVAPIPKDSTGTSGTTTFESVRATRGTFASRTFISKGGDERNSRATVATMSTAFMRQSRVEVRNDAEANQGAISTTRFVASRKTIQETRDTFRSEAPTSRYGGRGTPSSAATSIFFASRVDVSRRVETHRGDSVSACAGQIPTRQPLEALKMPTVNSVPTSRGRPATRSFQLPNAAVPASPAGRTSQSSCGTLGSLRRVSRPSISSQPSRTSVGSVRKGSRRRNDGGRQGGRMSRDLKNLPDSFYTPRIQTSLIGNKAASCDKTSARNRTQTFETSITDE